MNTNTTPSPITLTPQLLRDAAARLRIDADTFEQFKLTFMCLAVNEEENELQGPYIYGKTTNHAIRAFKDILSSDRVDLSGELQCAYLLPHEQVRNEDRQFVRFDYMHLLACALETDHEGV